MPVQQFAALSKDNQQFRQHLLRVAGGSLILAAVLGYFLDQKIALYFGRTEVRDVMWLTARELTNIGLSEHYFILAIGTWIFCSWLAPRWNYFTQRSIADRVDFFRRWGLNFFVALIVSGILTHLFKFFVGRQRPHMTPDFEPFTFSPLNTHWDYHSFSSGHSQTMWTVATMMTVAFPRAKWLWIFSAVAICSTRAIIHDHFLSDIIFGSCLGYVGSLIAMRLLKNKTKNGVY